MEISVEIIIRTDKAIDHFETTVTDATVETGPTPLIAHALADSVRRANRAYMLGIEVVS